MAADEERICAGNAVYRAEGEKLLFFSHKCSPSHKVVFCGAEDGLLCFALHDGEGRGRDQC
jgi:hypothetical protein